MFVTLLTLLANTGRGADDVTHGGGTAWDGAGRSPAMFSTFNIMPIGVAWKESSSNGPRPTQGASRGGLGGPGPPLETYPALDFQGFFR